MAYGDKIYKQHGIKEQKRHLILLNEIYNPKGIAVIEVTKDEDKRLGIDYRWEIIEDNKICRYSDLKTKKSEESDIYCLTSYTNYFHEYVFNKTKSLDYIFVSAGHYLHVYVKEIKKWYEDRHEFVDDYNKCGDFLCNDYPKDDSKYYKFPLSEVERMAYKKYPFKTI